MTQFRPGGFQTLPPVVKNIILINVLVVLVQFVLGKYGINLGDYLGLHYWQSPRFHWWQIITHIFVHGDPYDVQETFLHIFSNMFALWMFGRILENIWGPQRFLLFYFVCGIGAAFCHLGVLTIEFSAFEKAFLAYQQNPTLDHFSIFLQQHNMDHIPDMLQLQSIWADHPNCAPCVQKSINFIQAYRDVQINEATVGASGAVFGVLFAFGYLFPNTELFLLFPPIPIKAKWFVGIYALFELYAGISNHAGDNIAHFAHLGGMLFAFILLKIWNTKRDRFY